MGLTGCPPTGDAPPFNPSEAGVPGDPCTDTDGDGYVVGESCALPAGDCDPEDPTRNPGAAEICNRQDDDCDRATDEGDPGGGEDCTTDQPGLCSAGRTSCEQGTVVCTQIEQRALREDCNGIDDDCDGSTDEDDPGGGGDCETGQEGRCNAGTERCVGGGLTCVADVAADAEACNGVDDDCDGSTDEGDPGGGGACDTGLRGVCAVGIERCTGGNVGCIATAEATPETCNGLDDDCDGSTDEAFPTVGDDCVDAARACPVRTRIRCAADGRSAVCQADADRPPEAERCNDFDDDCDGRADEDFAGKGEACEGGLGICARPGRSPGLRGRWRRQHLRRRARRSGRGAVQRPRRRLRWQHRRGLPTVGDDSRTPPAPAPSAPGSGAPPTAAARSARPTPTAPRRSAATTSTTTAMAAPTRTSPARARPARAGWASARARAAACAPPMGAA
ncbi:MAG: putative metal-binding motif-containing protein [bacterium]